MKKALLIAAALAVTSTAAAAGKLEIFSWWSGDEAPAKDALIKLYKQKYPGVDVIDATVAGGAGTNAKAVLKTRMLGGTPPDSFQVHAGQELIGTWVVANRMEDLSSLFKAEGWNKVLPQDVIDLISAKGGIWSVPVNVHRSNVMWYNPAKLKAWGVTPPKTWAEFLGTCAKLKAKGVAAPLVVGENWTQQHLWENVMIGTLGPQGWRDLWAGKLKFTDPRVVQGFTNFGKVMDCANKDASGLSWQQASDRIADGTSAFNIMGDWAAGYFTTTKKLAPNTGFGWAPTPDTRGTFVMLADSFGLPKGAKDRTEAINWLKLVGSKQGQDTFNPLKGSIAARTDSDLSKYGTYSKSAAADWKTNKIVGSMVHGAVAPESFTSAFGAIIDQFVASKNAQGAAAAAQQLADRAGIGK
ncbi:carbohydrate ABC transporter substrate-binding protein [Deinococcus metallilatus]|uniref:Probable sugar-binding periplasmic protein n=1 Tax=Deinococcus metallilatus TaxID=1211322 RepID=A0AAJ5F0X7_9DEIO|nr:carbohydrate ABC transporter substrate-binding protein [Deinococcus metallilatus]RXJ10865.1 carbohydrate ABC transporter substrate-binding protein [Deinococcus metallilatus]TLK22200.1 carbohydrate ABC transporter substrate-binding protein [Deinococcus metallilatus]